MTDQKVFKKRLKTLMKKQENQICVDCNERQPRWASLIKPPPGSPDNMGMGAFMCLECSGSHRRLGVHISFVRSVNLDSWKEHEVQIMENGGNNKVNSAYEALLHRSGAQKPDNMATGAQRERYIRDKYERRKFYDPTTLQDYEDDEEESEEEEQPASRRKPVAAVSRAPSEAAQRRAAQRQARMTGKSARSDRPARINKVAATPKPEPAADLLDFGSMQSATAPVAAVTQPPAAPAPVAAAPPPATHQNETLDLFANMTVSSIASAAGPAPALTTTKTNDDIMSLFNAPQPTNNMMASPQMMMMMGQQQQQQQPQKNPMMQQMMNQQRMMMMQQQQQQQPPQQMQQQNAPNMHPQAGMMGMNQGGMQGMQQQQNMMMMMNNMNGQQMNPMMAQQQNNMQRMMQMQQQQPGASGMVNMAQQGVPNGNQGMMGSGPSTIQSNKPAEPPKDDPFSQFGFNAFR